MVVWYSFFINISTQFLVGSNAMVVKLEGGELHVPKM